jgi:hypothetical protein
MIQRNLSEIKDVSEDPVRKIAGTGRKWKTKDIFGITG